MSVYVIGDLQGCASEFSRLVDSLELGPDDEIWLCGDLVNRGPDSLETVRLLRDFPHKLRCVLGNHDLAVLAKANGAIKQRGKVAEQFLAATDGPELLHWLAQQPLAVHAHGLLMVHAGLPAPWNLEQLLQETARVEAKLSAGLEAQTQLFRNMFGNAPRRWSPSLSDWDRLRFTINALTRMRFVDSGGEMEFETKTAPDSAAHLQPWFCVRERRYRGPIVFGHWSTLGRSYWPEHNVWGLDSGCVWGGHLTALQWPDRRLIRLPCSAHKI